MDEMETKEEDLDEFCPTREDKIHCVHWWDGYQCCSCKAGDGTAPGAQYINILDFTKTPGARYKTDGPFSGEEFREKFLIPAYKNSDGWADIQVDLDGVYGFSTGFLEEAFGGLVRAIKDKNVINQICIFCDDEPSIKEEIKEYMQKAVNNLGS